MSNPPQQPEIKFENQVVFLETGDVREDGTFTFEMELPLLVMMQGSYCGHCKTMKPAFAQASKMLEGVVLCCTIHADSENPSERDLAMRLGKIMQIPGYPHTFLVRNGKIAKIYKGDRSAQDLVKFATSE
jgi:thiol-disulfide isomerase/thioredoxin